MKAAPGSSSLLLVWGGEWEFTNGRALRSLMGGALEAELKYKNDLLS